MKTKEGIEIVQSCSYCNIKFTNWKEYYKHLENPKEYKKET